MEQEKLKELLSKLKANDITFKLDGFIFAAKYQLRHIYFENSHDRDKLKDIIGKDNLKGTKFVNTLEWYLGETEKKLMLKFKIPPVLEIKDWEHMQTDDYTDFQYMVEPNKK